MEDVITTINNIAEGVKTLGLPIGILAFIIVGIMFVFAKDPQKKEMHSSWAVSIVMGLAIVWLASSVMNWLTEQITTYN